MKNLSINYTRIGEETTFGQLSSRDCFYSGGVLYMKIFHQDLAELGITNVNAISIVNAGLTFFHDDEQVYRATKSISSGNEKIVEAVLVKDLQEAISNLESHIQWLTKNYKEACHSAQIHVQQASYKDMATTIPRRFPELEKAYAEIERYDEQVKLLSYIIEKSKVSLNTICPAKATDQSFLS